MDRMDGMGMPKRSEEGTHPTTRTTRITPRRLYLSLIPLHMKNVKVMYVFLTHDKIRRVAPLSSRGQHMLFITYSIKNRVYFNV